MILRTKSVATRKHALTQAQINRQRLRSYDEAVRKELQLIAIAKCVKSRDPVCTLTAEETTVAARKAARKIAADSKFKNKAAQRRRSLEKSLVTWALRTEGSGGWKGKSVKEAWTAEAARRAELKLRKPVAYLAIPETDEANEEKPKVGHPAVARPGNSPPDENKKSDQAMIEAQRPDLPAPLLEGAQITGNAQTEITPPAQEETNAVANTASQPSTAIWTGKFALPNTGIFAGLVRSEPFIVQPIEKLVSRVVSRPGPASGKTTQMPVQPKTSHALGYEGWNRLIDPAAVIYDGDYSFSRMIRNLQPTRWGLLQRHRGTAWNNNPLHFKIHVSVKGRDVPQAWNAIVPYLIENEVAAAKVAGPNLVMDLDKRYTTNTQGFDTLYTQSSKQIVIADPGKLSWAEFSQGLEQRLRASNVEPGHAIRFDRQIEGSRYLFYRHAPQGNGEYIPATELRRRVISGVLSEAQAYNPLGVEDPLAGFKIDESKLNSNGNPAKTRPLSDVRATSERVGFFASAEPAMQEWHKTKLAKTMGVFGAAAGIYGFYHALQSDGEAISAHPARARLVKADWGHLNDHMPFKFPEFANLRLQYGIGRETAKNVAGIGGAIVGGLLASPFGAAAGRRLGTRKILGVSLAALGVGGGELTGGAIGYGFASSAADKAWTATFGKDG